MSFLGLASPTSLTGVVGDTTTPNREGEHCRSGDLVVDTADRKMVEALTNRVIPIRAYEGHPNHGEVTTLAIHND
jgi:hypothetical protein